MTAVIGGYFELELRSGEHYHKNALLLNSGRNCFAYILRARKYSKVYVPYYTCEVLLQPLQQLGIHYEFYSINAALEPKENVRLLPHEAFLYTNYFGLKQCCVERLAAIYGNQLIVDNSQAFFAPRLDAIDTFYSPRKFFGVPDGGYLYTDGVLVQNFPIDKSFERMRHLLLRIEDGAEKAYTYFKEADNGLDNQPIRQMSELTGRILQSIDYKQTAAIRCANFKYLQKELAASNRLSLELTRDAVPMVYPYYASKESLRSILIRNKVFIATYWPNVLQWCSPEDMEYSLSKYVVPIPVDQRYGQEEMRRITGIIKDNINE